MFKMLTKWMRLHLMGGRGFLLLERKKKKEERQKKKKEKEREKSKMERGREGRKEGKGRRATVFTLSPLFWNWKAESRERKFHIRCHIANHKERKQWSENLGLLIFNPCSFCYTLLGSKHMLRGCVASWSYFHTSPHFDTTVNCWSLGKLFFEKRD